MLVELSNHANAERDLLTRKGNSVRYCQVTGSYLLFDASFGALFGDLFDA